MIKIKNLDDLLTNDLKGKTVYLRADLNLPTIKGKVTDTTRIKNNLNWDAKTDIEKGIIQTCEWFIKNIEFISSIKIQD